MIVNAHIIHIAPPLSEFLLTGNLSHYRLPEEVHHIII
jgi:hypothetical protein